MMKKRIVAFLLSAAMVCSMVSTGLAVDVQARDTEFFTEQYHTDLDFSDMKFQLLDADDARAEMEEVRSLLDDAANTEAAASGFQAASRRMYQFYDMYILAMIASSKNGADAEAAENAQAALAALDLVYDELYALAVDILESPCAAALDGLLSREERTELLEEYEPMTEELLEKRSREQNLITEYWVADARTYTTEYDGRVWDNSSVEAAYGNGELDDDTYFQLIQAIAKEKNQVQGNIYLKLVALRKEMAPLYGYDNYVDAAYAEFYLRDYSPEEMQAFHDAVKEYIVPLDQAINILRIADYDNGIFARPYTGEEVLDLIEPYIAQMSDELLESFRYMRDHGLYDIEQDEQKKNQGFTTILPSYHAPFFFDAGWGDVADVRTAIHEFGHYNNYYWMDMGWNAGDKSIDTAEVHSQGMELLFTRYYPQLFGDGADAMENYTLSDILYSIVQGALYDELQQYAFSKKNLTLQDLNEEYCRLCREYGLIEEDDPRTEMYSWVNVAHSFESPFYYISYAVSAAGALSFWLETQEDYFAAVDDYLEFTALDTSYSFQESFAALEMESPISAAYLEKLADTLYTVLDVEARLAALPVVGSFTDVSIQDWFCEAVAFAYEYGLFSGTSDTTFEPNGVMTRGMLATVLYQMAGAPELADEDWADPFTDVAGDDWYAQGVYWARANGIAGGFGDGTFGPNTPITREQLAVMLYHCDENAAATGAALDFTDADRISGYALEAMGWAVERGILSGMGGGVLAPQGQATRAQTAQMLMRFLEEAA